MGNFNWLHLSDLHLEQFEQFDVSRMRNKLLEELKTLEEVKYIFITGDIANKSEYGNAKEIIDNIRAATGVSKENVFWSVGNHDISRNNKSRNNLIKRIRGNGNRGKKKFEAIISDDENRCLLYDFQFKTFYEKYNEILEYDPAGKPHAFYETDDLCIINLNTCITSFDDNDAHNLHIIEPNLLKIFEKKYDKPVFVLGHHSIDFFSDDEKEKVQEMFDGKADLYLCGHAHRLGYMLIPNTELEVHEITCGGGICDKYSVYSFVYGKYNSETKSIKVVPYSYRDRGNKKWQPDYELHRKLKKDAIFYFNRLLSVDERKLISKSTDLTESNKVEGSDSKSLAQTYFKVYDVIEKYHIDKRVKRTIETQGLELTCQKYTQYFSIACQIPETVKYIKDTCMFKELVDIIIETNSKFPLYISGEIGTGKSSFLTLLYLSLKKWGRDIVPLYFDLHSFEIQDKQVALQRFEEETDLFEKIIAEEKEKYIILIIDGIDDHNRLIGDLGINWVSDQINTLHGSQNKKIISLGLWGEDNGICDLLKLDDLEPTFTILLNRLNIFIKNDYIEKFVGTQLYDEKSIQDGVNKIKDCVEKWHLEKVDFRLLCMILDSEKSMIQKSDNYTTFLHKYCLNLLHYKDAELLRISKEAFIYNETNFNKENYHWEKNNTIIFRHREICSFLTSYYYVNILKGKDEEERKQMFRKKFVFSKESNGHIKNLIIHDKPNQLNIYQIMKNSLLYTDISFDMKAQLCYLLPRVFGEIENEDIRSVLQAEKSKINKKLVEIDNDTFKDYDCIDKDKELVLLLRTIVCGLAICGEFEPLYDFVKKILNDQRYMHLNRQFYIDYYANVSKDMSLENISLAEANRESIKTTLLQLRHQILRAVGTGSFRNYNLFVLDVVTYFTIIQECDNSDDKRLTKEQNSSAKNLLNTLLNNDEALKRLKKVQELYDYLHLLKLNIDKDSSIGVLENLYSLKTRKRAGWEARGIKNGESIADHIYGAYLLGLLYLPEGKPDFSDTDYSEYCKERVLNMILLHDIGESYTGDIVSTQKTDKEKFEEQQITRAIFMSSTYSEVSSLVYYKEIWDEFTKNSTINARVAHEIDKIENLVQILIYRKAGKNISDFEKWKGYLRNRMVTALGKNIYEFIENSLS